MIIYFSSTAVLSYLQKSTQQLEVRLHGKGTGFNKFVHYGGRMLRIYILKHVNLYQI